MVDKTFDGPDLGTGKCVRVMRCVVSGLFPQAARLSPAGVYCGVRGAQLHIATNSCLYHHQQPKWVVFAGVVSVAEKTYMRDLMTIQKDWLIEVAPHYYRET
ncbi:putative ATP-dependent RNA helicase DHX35 [Papilio machaon]|uniref:Putative ATP-dependent RNA helicase DHX35 n=1 Tax=Papilio machaon TaxID=76193 RepID=A0A0N1IHK3_PAPMA|nr:putative ATP-dependent RNA helicase DHX35 [Papilio machaon]